MNCPNCNQALPAGAKECPGCGIILAKWQAAKLKPAPSTTSAAAPPASSSSSWLLWGVLLVAAGGVWYWRSQPAHMAGRAGTRWEEASDKDFDAQVLQSPVPTLVYLDPNVEFHRYDGVFFSVLAKHAGQLRIVHVGPAKAPQALAKYVANATVRDLLLFKNGQIAARTDDRTLLEKGMAALQAKMDAKYKDQVLSQEEFNKVKADFEANKEALIDEGLEQALEDFLAGAP